MVERVTAFLETRGCTITGTSHTRQRGVDIKALVPQTETLIFIEAKGQTSSKIGTKRYGEPFTKSQKISHVSRALFECCRQLSIHDGERIATGIALPDDQEHRELLSSIGSVLSRIGILVFLVGADDGTVQVWGSFPEK